MSLAYMESGGSGEEHDVGTDAQPEAGKRKVQRWTAEEHNRLEELVRAAWPNIKWPQIAAALNTGRTGKQCRERHLNVRPENKKGSWTFEEEKLIAKLHSEMGPAWSKISKRLTARTENDTKNARMIRDGAPACPATYEGAMLQFNMHNAGCSSPQPATSAASPSAPAMEQSFNELLHVCTHLAQQEAPQPVCADHMMMTAPQLLQPSPQQQQRCYMPPPVRVDTAMYLEGHSSASTMPITQLPASSGSDHTTLCQSLEAALHKTRETAMRRMTTAMPAPAALPAYHAQPSPAALARPGIAAIATHHGLENGMMYPASEPNSAVSVSSHTANHGNPFARQAMSGMASPMDLPTLVMEAPVPRSSMHGMTHGCAMDHGASTLELSEQHSSVPGWGCDANMMQELEQVLASNQSRRQVKRCFSALESDVLQAAHGFRAPKVVRRHASCLPVMDGSNHFMVDAATGSMLQNSLSMEHNARGHLVMAPPQQTFVDAINRPQLLRTLTQPQAEFNSLPRQMSGCPAPAPALTGMPQRYATPGLGHVVRSDTPADLQQMYNDLVGGQMDVMPVEHVHSMQSHQAHFLPQQNMLHMQGNAHPFPMQHLGSMLFPSTLTSVPCRQPYAESP